MFYGARDMDDDGRMPWASAIIVILGLSLLLWLLLFGIVSAARAQMSGALSNCSQTVSTGSTAVTFPTSGATGPTAPQNYLRLCNAHGSNTLGVNALGGTAAIGSAGTLTLAAGACLVFDRAAGIIPPALAIIGSGSGTTTACWYH